jgi:hypothetical protein
MRERCRREGSNGQQRDAIILIDSNGETIMMRKTAIALAAFVALTFGSASDVFAHGGGHGGGFGGGFGRVGRGSFAPGFAHAPGFHSGRFAFRRHRFLRDGFFFAGDPLWYDYDYGYDQACYRRVWTRWGWEWAWVCN